MDDVFSYKIFNFQEKIDISKHTVWAEFRP